MARWLFLPRTILSETQAAQIPLTVDNLDPAIIDQGVTNFDITVTGTGFVEGALAEFSGDGVTVNSVTFVNGTTLTINVDVAADAPLEDLNLTITNPDAMFVSVIAAINIALPAELDPPPEITTVTPGTGDQSETLDVTVAGSAFVDGAAVTFSGTGITVNSTTFVAVDELTANVTIAADATLSARDVTVTNPDLQTGSAIAAFEVVVAAAAAPTVTEAAPASVPQAYEDVLEIFGTGFVDGAVVTFSGAGLSLFGDAQVVSPIYITVLLTVDFSATPGARDVTVTNPDTQSGTLVGGLTITAL